MPTDLPKADPPQRKAPPFQFSLTKITERSQLAPPISIQQVAKISDAARRCDIRGYSELNRGSA